METVNQQSPMESTPEQQKSSVRSNFFTRNKKLIIIISAILITLYISVQIYLYFAFKKINKLLQSSESFPTRSVSQPSPTPDLTANWKTYTDDKFYFKYPPTYCVRQIEKDFIVIFPELCDTPKTDRTAADISIDARLSSYNINYDQAVEAAKKLLVNTRIENIPNGIKLSGSFNIPGIPAPKHGEGKLYVIVKMKYKNGAISIEYSQGSIKLSTFDQILSTFKFLD